jgi:PE-PPE domain/PE family
MEYLVTAPEMLATTAANVEEIGSEISAANASAAGPTTGLVAAAEDEVSAAIAKLFGGYGQQYQAVLTQAGAFHNEFAQTLAAAGNTYAQAEASNVAAMSNALSAFNGPIQTLLGRTPFGVSGSSGTSTQIPIVKALTATQVALVMGGTGNPGPDLGYLNAVAQAYLLPRFPGLQLSNVFQQFTPEQFWPVTPQLGGLTFGQSVAQGVSLLDSGIKAQLAQGNNVVVFGYSQSATVATDEIRALMAMGSGAPASSQLSFILAGDPNNPDGGLLERFPGFYIPILDVAFNGATPPNSPYPTSIYTIQYDGIADAPQYPLNVVSDLNAFLGYFFVHGNYPFLTPDQVAGAVPLPTSPGYTGDTQYYMVMTQDLPLVQLIRDIPYAGPPIADIFQPDLRVIVDLGYGDIGPGGFYANVPTPASLFSIPNPITVTVDLARGAVQGPYSAALDIGVEAGLLPPTTSLYPDTYPYVPSPDPHLHIQLGQQSSVTGLSVLSGAVGRVLELIPPDLFE